MIVYYKMLIYVFPKPNKSKAEIFVTKNYIYMAVLEVNFVLPIISESYVNFKISNFTGLSN